MDIMRPLVITRKKCLYIDLNVLRNSNAMDTIALPSIASASMTTIEFGLTSILSAPNALHLLMTISSYAIEEVQSNLKRLCIL